MSYEEEGADSDFEDSEAERRERAAKAKELVPAFMLSHEGLDDEVERILGHRWARLPTPLRKAPGLSAWAGRWRPVHRSSSGGACMVKAWQGISPMTCIMPLQQNCKPHLAGPGKGARMIHGCGGVCPMRACREVKAGPGRAPWRRLSVHDAYIGRQRARRRCPGTPGRPGSST